MKIEKKADRKKVKMDVEVEVESENSLLVVSKSSKKTNCIFRILALVALLAFSGLGTGFSLLCYDKFRIKEIGKQKVFFKSTKLCFKPEVFYML